MISISFPISGISDQPGFAANKGKVGLVLSGGGAKGLAHIGVIKALEDSDIPIDYIAGTSMGAIIGGLYAAGYSPEEMLELFLSEEFNLWSKGEVEEKYGYFAYKLSPQPDVISMSTTKDENNKTKAVIPTNLVSSFPMDLGMIKIFARASAVAGNQFDRLFVPFRCVAADVNKGKAYVASKGDLGIMIRASMSYPLYFKPVAIDSTTLLFDGGLHNNFPWDVIEKDFNPEYIIGSKCVSGEIHANEDDLMGQIERMVMRDTNYDLPPQKGMIIENRMEEIGLLDFQKVNELMAYGYNQTLKMIDSIKHMIPSRRTAFDVAMRRINFRASMPGLNIRDIKVDQGDLNTYQREYIQKNMIFDTNKTIDIEEFKDVYYKIICTGNVKTFFPTPVFDSISRTFDIHIRAKKSPEGKISIGGNIGSGNINQGYLGLEYRWWKKKITRTTADFHVGRLYSSIRVGIRQDFPAKRPFFFEINGVINRFHYYDPSSDIFFDNTSRERRKESGGFGEIAIGSTLRKNTAIRIGASGGAMRSFYLLKNTPLYTSTGSLERLFTRSLFSYASAYGSFHQNTLNFKQYPTKGKEKKLEFRLLFGRETHQYSDTARFENSMFRMNVHGMYESYIRLSPYVSMGFLLEAALTGKTNFSDYGALIGTLPAFAPTPHSKTVFINDYRAYNWGAAGVIPVITLTDKFSIRCGAYLFQPYETVSPDENQQPIYGKPFSDRSYMGIAAATWQSPIGPVSFSVNYYDKGLQKFNYMFNFGYILFNPKGM